jgi:hypothetical protein
MERIEEELFKKNVCFEAEDPYAIAVSIFEACRRIGKIKEKVNKYLTSGPRKKFELVFYLTDNISRYTRVVFLLEITGEMPPNIINIGINGTFQTRLPQRAGFVGEVFTEYYIKNVMPQARGVAKQRAAMLEKEILNIIDHVITAEKTL